MKKIFFLLFAFSINFLSGELKKLPNYDTEAVLEFIAKFLPENPTILEAGAYNGDDSGMIAKFWPKGRLFCFEPIPQLYEQVIGKTAHLANVKSFQKALSDSSGFAQIHVSMIGSQVWGSSSLLAPKNHLFLAPFVSFPSTIEVETLTLDDWAAQEGVDHIDFLWLDLQGYELNVLKTSEIAKKAKVIWTEVEFDEAYAGQYLYKDIHDWMIAHGFEPVAATIDLEKPDHWFGDALFIKKVID